MVLNIYVFALNLIELRRYRRQFEKYLARQWELMMIVYIPHYPLIHTDANWLPWVI
jgi:hypothetical protein